MSEAIEIMKQIVSYVKTITTPEEFETKRFIRPSSIHRLVSCPWYATFGEALVEPPKGPNVEAALTRGSAIHAAVQRGERPDITGLYYPATATQADPVFLEVPLVNKQWNLVGTADFMYYCPAGKVLYVRDLKTGKSTDRHSFFWQTLTYALIFNELLDAVFAGKYNIEIIDLQLIHLPPLKRKAETPKVSWHLSKPIEELVSSFQKILSVVEFPVEDDTKVSSPSCGFCPNRYTCEKYPSYVDSHPLKGLREWLRNDLVENAKTTYTSPVSPEFE